MTREDAKQRFWADGSKTHNHNEIIDIVFDDFESRTCENCIYYNDMNESSGLCENLALPELGVNKDFGCNKFERK